MSNIEEVQVTVIFPQTFRFQFGKDENLTNEQKQEKIREHAAYLMETSQAEPVIHDCSDSSLID